MSQPGRKKKERPSGGTQILFVRHMPKMLMRHFRAWCSLRGITQQDKLISLITECVQNTQTPYAGEKPK
jgi:hypothetical protein